MALRALLGVRVWHLFSPQIDADGSVYRSYSFSIDLESMVEGVPILQLGAVSRDTSAVS